MAVHLTSIGGWAKPSQEQIASYSWLRDMRTVIMSPSWSPSLLRQSVVSCYKCIELPGKNLSCWNLRHLWGFAWVAILCLFAYRFPFSVYLGFPSLHLELFLNFIWTLSSHFNGLNTWGETVNIRKISRKIRGMIYRSCKWGSFNSSPGLKLYWRSLNLVTLERRPLS